MNSVGLFTYPFNKHLLCAHFVSGTVLSIGDIAVTKTAKGKTPDLKALTVI